MASSWRRTEVGFTLVEVLISILIMSMLTVLISGSIRTAVRNKKALEIKIQSETELYDSLRIIKMDVERAFHYQDVFFEIENLAIQQLEAEKRKAGQNPQGPQGAPGQQRPAPIKLTQFLGESQSMHFTALNHFRTQYNAPESDQMEVGYYVDGCESRDGKGSSKCLWRRSSPQIDDEVDKGGAKLIVAYGVQKFELKYRSNKEQDEWVDQWRSDNKGRTDHRDRFPHFVEVTLEMENTDKNSKKTLSQSMVVRVAFPNNEPHFQNIGQGQQGPGGGRN